MLPNGFGVSSSCDLYVSLPIPEGLPIGASELINVIGA